MNALLVLIALLLGSPFGSHATAVSNQSTELNEPAPDGTISTETNNPTGGEGNMGIAQETTVEHYAVGQEITLANTTLTVNSVTFNEIPKSDSVDAVINFDVVTTQEPERSEEWPALRFVQVFTLANGKTIWGGQRTTDFVKANEKKTVEITMRVPKDNLLKSITVSDSVDTSSTAIVDLN